MTDYENLMDEFAESQKLTFSERHKARSALQSAIEALQKEVSTLDVLLEECKMDWSGDVTQIKAEHKREIQALQSAGRTLEQLGYTNAGGELWKPPIGKAPDFNLIDQLRAERDQLQSKLGDAIQSSAHWQHQFTEAQAEVNAASSAYELANKRADAMEAERDQLQSMGKGEPVGFVAPHDLKTLREGYPATVVMLPSNKRTEPLFAAPKALAPLTQPEVVEAFCNTRHNTQYVSVFDAGVRFAEKHHRIGGTP